MKRLLFFILVIIVILSICLFIFNCRRQANPLSKKSELVQQASNAAKTNSLPTGLNVTSAQNIMQWKASITNLLQINVGDPGDVNNWIMEQKNPNTGIPFIVGDTNGAWIQFNSWFVNIDAKKSNGDIRSLEIQSVRMNILEIRSNGDALLKLMSKDEKSFNAWCDKVGNRWMDEPEFTSVASHLPNSDKTFGFQVRSTFNNDKPWYILLIITDK